ncbi:MAG: cation:dicarboxylase symporter family transporter, partial [Bacteroidales bacterium]|nr:cation:dicarboxylase symporter family transporter [Bacteroidales bacterium]
MNQSTKQFAIWAAALVVGAVIGLLHIDWIEEVFNFIATVYTRLFQFLAVPTVALAIVTTMISFGKKRSAKRLFARTLTYTLLTTFAAALVGMLLYMVIAPGNIPSEMIPGGQSPATGASSFKDHIISVIPDNIVAPLLSGNVLSIL